MAITGLKALQQFIIREIFKDAPTGVMRTLPNQELVDMNVQILAQRLMQGGIDPKTLKNANQVENAINMIESRPPVQQGIKSTKSAKVFDMEGKEIPKGSKIMGGKAVKETEAEMAARMKEENKEAIKRFKQKMEEDRDFSILDPEDMAQGGRAGFKTGLGKRFLELLKGKKTKPKGDKIYGVGGEEIDVADLKKSLGLDEATQKKDMEDLEKKLQMIIGRDKTKHAIGGRAGFDNGGAPGPGAPSIKYDFDRERPGSMGPAFETDDPKEAAREVIKRLIRIEGAQIPLTKKGSLGIAIPSLDKAGIGGLINLLGGEVEFGGMKDFGTGDEKLGFRFRKEFGGGKDKRVNRKEGGMSRRTFMKILGGLASIPIVGKILKPVKIGKTVSKVPIIKTENVAGKPEWFDSLVNKVIVEGDDVTKRFATGERQTIHQKTLDDGSVVRVTEETDQGAVRVEYESSENVFGDPVQMEYKKPLPDEGAPDPRAEFTTAESGPVGRQYGPDDFEIEVEEIGGGSIRDLDSDVSKLKEYATGKKPTIKEMMQNKRRKDKAARISEDSEAQTDAIIARQGDYDAGDYDYASGGIAGMLGE